MLSNENRLLALCWRMPLPLREGKNVTLPSISQQATQPTHLKCPPRATYSIPFQRLLYLAATNTHASNCPPNTIAGQAKSLTYFHFPTAKYSFPTKQYPLASQITLHHFSHTYFDFTPYTFSNVIKICEKIFIVPI